MGGHVYLVGAGPGDPELLTMKAYRLIRSAEVLIYDRLVGQDIVRLADPNCERIYVGKRKHLHVASQDEINRMLIQHGAAGKQVVRLKGGDPFIFGRGGEELAALQAEGIACTVVPGVTAAVGAAASVGLPLTLRDHAAAVTFVTAHKREGRLAVDWDLITRPGQHVAIYMGFSLLDELVDGLRQRGVPAKAQLTVVSQATQREERSLHTTLADAVEDVHRAGLASPAILFLHDLPAMFTQRQKPPQTDALRKLMCTPSA